MYTIPYFLKNEAKNLLKFKLTEVVKDITNEMIDNIFNSNYDNTYQNFMLKLDHQVKEKILEIIKEVFKIFDNLYVNSIERKKLFNISNPNCHRSIFTIFGLIDFERVYYYDKSDKNKHFYFIDSLFNLPSYDRYDTIVKGLAIANAIDTNQKKGAEITNNYINTIYSSLNNDRQCNISRQDIYLWIDKWEVPNVQYDAITTDSDTLYIMIDEKYIHEQIHSYKNKNKQNNDIPDEKNSNEIKLEVIKDIMENIKNPPNQLLLPAPKENSKHYIMSKAFITFTDIKTINNRKILNNKITFLTSSKKPWDDFMDFIPNIFDFKQFNTIKVLSDAGSWIISGISNLKLFVNNIVIPCLCEFHAKQKINRSTKDENMRRLLINCLEENNKDAFNNLFNILLKDKSKSKKRIETLKSYKHYIIVHWEAIQNMDKSKYKSSMESHISHNIAKYFSYEPKAFASKHIEKLLKLHQHKANGINIQALYYKSSNSNEKITIKKEELSFAMFEKNSSNLPILYSANSFTSIAIRQLTSQCFI